MQIIKASLKNLDQMVDLFDAYRVFYRKVSDKKSAKEFLEARLKQEESVIFIAINDTNDYLGFVQLYPLFSSTNMRKTWLLNDLYVTESARGMGVSKRLISQSKVLATETNAVGLSLETERNNTIGNNLYPKVGFTLDTEHNFYFWSTKQD